MLSLVLKKISVPKDSLLAVREGDVIQENDLIAEVMPQKNQIHRESN